jgi:hypothetical protein
MNKWRSALPDRSSLWMLSGWLACRSTSSWTAVGAGFPGQGGKMANDGSAGC